MKGADACFLVHSQNVNETYLLYASKLQQLVSFAVISWDFFVSPPTLQNSLKRLSRLVERVAQCLYLTPPQNCWKCLQELSGSETLRGRTRSQSVHCQECPVLSTSTAQKGLGIERPSVSERDAEEVGRDHQCPWNTFLPQAVWCCRALHWLLPNISWLWIYKASGFPRLFMEASLPSLYLPALSWGGFLAACPCRAGRRRNRSLGIAQSGNQTGGLCCSFP